MCAYTVRAIWFILNARFISGSLKFEYVPGRGVPTWLAPSNNSGHSVSNGIRWLVTFHPCCHSSVLGELSVSYVTQREQILGSLCLVSPGPHSMYLFPFLFCFVYFCCKKSQLRWLYAQSPSTSSNLGVASYWVTEAYQFSGKWCPHLLWDHK